MHDNLSRSPVVRLCLWDDYANSRVEEIEKALIRTYVLAVLLRVFERLQYDVPHNRGVVLAILDGEELAVFVVDVRLRVPRADGRLGVFGQVQDRIAARPMDPVGTDIDQMAVWKLFLVEAASNAISTFQNRDIETVLEQEVGTPKPRNPSTYHSNVWLLARV